MLLIAWLILWINSSIYIRVAATFIVTRHEAYINTFLHIISVGRDCVVGITTRYGLDGQGIESR
jgi:hypothetical protein